MASPLITIENIARNPPGPVTVHLDHGVYCAQAGDCRCPRQRRGRVDFDHEKRRKVVSPENKRFPEAITLSAPGTPGSSRELHKAVLETEDGKRLLAERKIRVKAATPEAAAAPPVAPVPSPGEAEKPDAGLPAKKPPTRKPDAPPAPTAGG